jgi:hypothetical protein
MEYEDSKEDKRAKGRKRFKKDVAEAVEEGNLAANKKGKAKQKRNGWQKVKRKGKASAKYDGVSAAELYQKVKQKRDELLAKKGIPMKIPRGKARLIEICKKLRIK